MKLLSITAHQALPSPGHLGLGRQTIAASEVDSMAIVAEGHGVLYAFEGRRILVPWASLRYAELAPEESTASLMDAVEDILEEAEPAPKPKPKRKKAA